MNSPHLQQQEPLLLCSTLNWIFLCSTPQHLTTLFLQLPRRSSLMEVLIDCCRGLKFARPVTAAWLIRPEGFSERCVSLLKPITAPYETHTTMAEGVGARKMRLRGCKAQHLYWLSLSAEGSPQSAGAPPMKEQRLLLFIASFWWCHHFGWWKGVCLEGR